MRRILLRGLSVLAALGAAGTAAAQSRQVTPEAAPASWVAYAGTVNQALIGWLGAETPDGAEIRAYLDATRPAPDQPTAEMLFKLWIDPEGIVARVEFPPMADEQINQKIRGLIVAQQLPAPPKGMLLPLRLMVQLAPPPPPSAPEVVPIATPPS